VLEKGKLVLRASSPQAVDYYLTSGFSQTGERYWQADEVSTGADPFRPISLRVLDSGGKVADTVRSVEPITVEVEYKLRAPITGLRVGLYLMATHGEHIFTSFDIDDQMQYDRFGVREAGRYISRCEIPADFLNEGRYVLGINASAFRVKRYFQDEHALAFTVDAAGAPGMQWLEPRLGPIRPRLKWQIVEKLT